MQVLRRGDQLVAITPEIREFLKEPKLLIVTKSAVRARVHRRAYMDYVGIKQFDAAGKLAGELRIVGLFTSTAYTQMSPARSLTCAARSTPVVERAGFVPEGHSGKALINVLETYPRDELFQIDEDLLYQFALAILQLDERPRVRVLSRRDRFDRFVSVLVYVPRDRYDSGVRQAIGEYLAKVYKGHVSAFYPFFPEGPLVRVHFIIGRRDGATPDPDRATLEAAVGAIVRTWTDALMRGAGRGATSPAARTRCSSAIATPSRKAFARAYSPPIAVARHPGDRKADRRRIRSAPTSIAAARRGQQHRAQGLEPRPADRAVGARAGAGEHGLPRGRRADLPDRGRHAQEPDVWLHDMTIERADGGAFDLDAVKQQLEAHVPGRHPRRRRERRLQRAGAGGRADVARRGADAHHRALPAADPRALFARLHVGRRWSSTSTSPPRSCGCSSSASIRGLTCRASNAKRDEAELAGRDRNRAAGGRKPRRGPHPAPLRQCGAVGGAHQFLSARRRRPAEGA